VIINFEVGPIPYGWINPPQAIFFGFPAQGVPILPIPGQYRLLKDHWIQFNSISGEYYLAGTIVVEGVDIPFGWVPTLDVEPLNGRALTAYYNAGPRGWLGVIRNQFVGIDVPPPVTYWSRVPGGDYYILTGLGTGLAPISALIGRIENP
jgi:hypothetical protein